MKTLKYFLIALLFPAFVLTGCKDDPIDDDTVTKPAYELLKDHLITTGMDLNHVLKSTDGKKFVTFPDVANETTADFLAKYYIIDIRDAATFAKGYLDGAKNIPVTKDTENDLTPVLADAANAGDKPILMVCYTGQGACYATALLRLSGYYNTQALKWGMSGWNGDFDSWSGNVADIAKGNTNWTSDITDNALFSYPDYTSTSTDGATILEQSIAAVAKAGFKGVVASVVLESPIDYSINNYFKATHYTGFGHIKGAYRVFDDSGENKFLGLDYDKNLDPNKTVVTYCYTGQTSSVITAYLNVLGYDAKSLKFGMNGLYNANPFWADPAITNQWGYDSKSKDFDYIK